MKNFYGPYYRADADDSWHWRNDCPRFPEGSLKTLISSDVPEQESLCPICKELELQENGRKELAKDHKYI